MHRKKKINWLGLKCWFGMARIGLETDFRKVQNQKNAQLSLE